MDITNRTTRNVFISILAGAIVFGVTLLILSNTYFPIEQKARQDIINKECPNGLENCGLIIEPSPIFFIFIIPAIATYIILLHFLERKKAWKEEMR